MDQPEDPPGDRDHPHDDGDHQHDVVHHVAAKLTEAASHVIATSLIRKKNKKKQDNLFVYLVVLDTSQALDDGYPKEEEQANASSSEDQHPGHVRLGRAVGVRVAGRHCLKHKGSLFTNHFNEMGQYLTLF